MGSAAAKNTIGIVLVAVCRKGLKRAVGQNNCAAGRYQLRRTLSQPLPIGFEAVLKLELPAFGPTKLG